MMCPSILRMFLGVFFLLFELPSLVQSGDTIEATNICDTPADSEDPAAKRVHIEDVSKYSEMFLTDVRKLPAVCLGTVYIKLKTEAEDEVGKSASLEALVGETAESKKEAVNEEKSCAIPAKELSDDKVGESTSAEATGETSKSKKEGSYGGWSYSRLMKALYSSLEEEQKDAAVEPNKEIREAPQEVIWEVSDPSKFKKVTLIYHLELEEPSDDDPIMKKARERIGETEEVMKNSTKELAELLEKETTFTVPSDNPAYSKWLLRFLRLRKYDVRKTYELIKSYYKFKADYHYIYDGLVPSHEYKVAKEEALGVLPNRDQAGRRIFLSRAKKWDPNQYTMLQAYRIGILLSETGAYEPATQLAGVQIIFDLSGITRAHVMKLEIVNAGRLVHWLLNCAPFRYEGIHIVKQPEFFTTVYNNVIKRFLSKEFIEKMHFHGRNMKSLHKHIFPEYLPVEYGGKLPMPGLNGYEWNIILKTGDEEYAKIDSYGFKKKSKTWGSLITSYIPRPFKN